jgi:3-deoxy-D-manno-octulosonic-acid transferase
MRWLYSAVLVVLALGYLPVFLLRKVRGAGYPLALGERLGFVPVAAGAGRFWVHAVSVGEVAAAEPLVKALHERWPATEIVVSTVTGTGARVARERLRAAAAVVTLPLDLPGAMRRAVSRIGPRCFIALETELWPNLLFALRRAGAPAVLANGRISDRSFRRYRRVRGLFRRVLQDVSLFAMQSTEDARRIVELGAPPERVVITGNLKMEARAGEEAMGAWWRARLGLGDDTVLVAGSTHRGEEAAVLDAWAEAGVAATRLVLAPRHPERLDEVEALVRSRGHTMVRRSRAGAGSREAVILLDTMGELASLYAAADVVFVGGSLVPIGGHNVIEPAVHARPVCFGPHMTNFREASALLLERGGARQVGDAGELAALLRELAGDPGRRVAMGRAAWSAVQGHQGACARTIAALAACLDRSPA